MLETVKSEPIEVLKTEHKTNIVYDPGIDETSKKLTRDQIERTVKQVLKKESARLKVYLKTCIHCGLCSEACHSYLSHDNNPAYSPVGKIKQTLWELVNKKGKVDGDFIRNCAKIAFTECNACRRCSMYCPFGIDMAYLILIVRRICHLLGVVPQYLQDTVNSHAVTMNQMWVKQDEWIETLQWMEDEARADVKTARIPLDVKGADIMYSVIGPEPKFLPQLLGNMAIIMNVAGEDWTMPTFDGWDNSNMPMYSGDFEIMARVERCHYEAALKLKSKKIVMGECGHAFRGAAYDGPKWLAWKDSPIPIIHAVQFYYELLRDGKIKIAKKYEKPVTFQEPCNIVRGRGLGDMLRYVMNAMCEDFRDVKPKYEHNYCCNAGGGTINCGPPWKRSRMLGNRVKAEQLESTGAEVVVTPCHNCHSGIEDIVGFYNLEMDVRFISEILLEVMEIPDELRI